MKKLTCTLAAALVVAPALALGGDVLETLGLESRDVEDGVMALASRGEVFVPSTRKAAQAIPASQRAGLVKALGEVAKAWTKTDAFKERYAKQAQASRPKEPAKPRTGAQAVAEEKAKMEKSLSEAEQAISVLPPEQRGPAQQALETARQQYLQNLPPAEAAEQQEQVRWQQDKEEYDRAVAKAMPLDPKEGLRRRLEKLLELTDKVDYKAKLVAEGDKKHFASKDLEAKPPEWKLCFRVGKEACEAARSFGRAWLAELK